VIVFHSSAKSIRSYQKEIPFWMVGDPNKVFYKEFAVETSLRFMSLKALGAAMRGVVRGHLALRLSGGSLGLPADFLIAPSGQIKAVKYGTDAYDQWSVDELLALAKDVAAQAALNEESISSSEANTSASLAGGLAGEVALITGGSGRVVSEHHYDTGRSVGRLLERPSLVRSRDSR